ncbi:glutamate-5-semialdehyde dehydrogenase [Aneurinibacillus aneurinilyticus]|jgi:glutamate-5-semialdehyde dehydrogenase|uniref:Gamma-glutamyl phosphate reductase n=2 Tax=Aneurinibacillus aneurinilyticus TaxID=1391 RepID=A0A848CS79_ANEAE|nr:glutamate-5-semialdehyde dehydrogenase [Aneurinibacillus aneurinilyticus]ERI07677.1 glutamate-5-semialdehyde dehydrogenase [Aneurinibacillus aneurinilyticus ATCC 12856]MED0705599.1 glutamate-5-semialdehyde dehydrogenase [Aneurinibacillus aneurinilyticus]MED0724490.1 glutamate-5-semialdehyde dehydrogenase [Aneurinibacillus aneurinilyticus]MED0731325.1 glutamate-5-semialdehyde dehydrogenase [Aneurinibacillus aneurinilyticus]MED0739359.1 glutamate-5-semialdehyde dehydrogenase [Aneurinibacillus
MTLLEKAKLAKQAAAQMLTLTTEEKNKALLTMADALENNISCILEANAKDIEAAKQANVTDALIDRLALSEARIHDMAEGLRQVVELEDPIGEVLEAWDRPNGLHITKVRVPLGVIGMIYEARPNVTVDATGLCLKAGNTVLLRGSSSALSSNQMLVKILREALTHTKVPEEAVQLLEEGTREEVNKMLKMNDYLDVLIPRGGAGLIRSVVENASVPVLETGAGNCHVYVDESAKPDMARDIVVNAKTHRPAVCNAAETLLVHESWAREHLVTLLTALKEKNVELRGCERTRKLAEDISIAEATEEDWGNEYLGYTMAVAIVDSTDDAIDHINRYSTKHSEAIVTDSEENARNFQKRVDSAAVYHNASTRFTDGFEFGFGAEIGISTQKLHARGPMGLPALTSFKYVIYGTGQIR